MNLHHFERCQVGVFARESTNSSPTLNLTPTIIGQFDKLFDLNLHSHLWSFDLALVQILLCYRAEVICLFFIAVYFTQSAVITLGSHLSRLYSRRRRGSFVLKKKGGFYTVESFIFNSFQQRTSRLDWSNEAEQEDATLYIKPSRYLTAKKCITLVLLFCHLFEIYFTASLSTHLRSELWPSVVALLLVLHHLFWQTQPSDQIVLSGDSLSPSIHSCASQVLISIFWFVTLLNTALSIQQFSIHFAVPHSPNGTSTISALQTCTACQWQTLSLSTDSAIFQDSAFHARHIISKFYFNCLYLSLFLAQLVIAFFPDYDVKSQSKYDSPLEIFFDPVTSKKLKNIKAKHEINPEDKATFLSKLTFTWFSSTIFRGFKSPLSLADIFPTSCSNRVENLSKKFFTFFNQENSQPEYLNRFPSLRKFRLIFILVRLVGFQFLQIALIKLIPTLLTFLGPVMLHTLIRFVESDEPHWHGYVYMAAIFVLPLTESLLNSLSDYQLNILALNIRSCLTSAIYERMLHCHFWSSTSSRYTSATLINIMSIDTQRVFEFIKTVNLFWICPLQISIAIYMLWAHLGYGSLAGLAVLLLLLPFNGFIGTRLRSLQAKLLQFKDHRIKVLHEAISKNKLIKFYAYEEFFQKRIQQWRQQEVTNLKRQAYYATAVTFAFNSAPFFVAFASFAMYLLLNEFANLDAKKMFVCLAIFNVVRKPIAFFPSAIANSMMFTISIKRISDFLDSIDEPKPTAPLRSLQLQKTKPSIKMDNCTFSWFTNGPTSSASNFHLNNISIQITDPKLCVVIGEIGSGKSSLLSAVLGQMNLLSEKTKDHFNVNGSIAYVPQNAWIQSGTIRDNILFGRKYDHRWYQKVIEACALEKDFQQLTDGDQMMVGQKGVSLSGGQKQRISIARALYSNPDICLFDGPLSALDTQIAKHVFTRVIGPSGLLAGKIRLLVTHNMAILPRVDHILLLKNGSIAASGQYRELMNEENEFTDFLAGFLSQSNANLPLESLEITEVIAPEDLQVLEEMATRLEKQFRSFTRRGSVRRQFSCQRSINTEPQLISFTCISSPTRTPTSPPSFLRETTNTDRIIDDQIESSKTGSVSCKVYFTYISRVGLLSSICILLFFFTGHVFMLFSLLWLSTLNNDHNKSSSSPLRPLYEAINATELSRTQFSLSFLGVYGFFGFGMTIFILLGTLFLNIDCLRASRHLHDQMLTRIMAAPIWFFDASSSSTGQILNRFTKDIDIADTTLISNFLKLIIELFRTIASFCPIILGTNPAIILIFIPLTLVYFAIYKYCIATSRQLIRLESALRTPIYSFFTETYLGVSVIQAFGMEQQFIRRNHRNIDKNSSALNMSVTASRWMAIRLELLGNLVVLCTATFCVLNRDNSNSGTTALAMTCAYTVTGTLNMLIRSFTDLTSNIVSIERLVEFTELPQEAARYLTEAERKQLEKSPINSFLSNCVPLCSGDLCQAEEGLIQSSPVLATRNVSLQQRPGHWLQNGDISICQYSARYRDNLDFCLRDLNLTIKHGSNVAIVGRTGAGKSSFALALFRLIEAASNGYICISGRNIKDLGLHELRSSLTIIPQDALLFSGTLRENMDPLGQYSDDQILVALAKVNLTDLLLPCQGPKLGSALDQQLDESRLSAISGGRRNLLCLARVLLRQPKVLILDEATADIDPATEELVQETIHREFEDCTVFSIVHRLDSVFRYPTDHVLVLDGGQVAEFDSPEKLAANSKSLFYQMLQNRL